MRHVRHLLRFAWLAATAAGSAIFAQPAVPSAAELKKLSLEELLNQEVLTVTRRTERLSESPSAVQLVTGDDIQRSPALTLGEALRLAPNLQIAQQNAHDWAITARGFNGAPLSNNSLADKLLVMIDGRSVYTPLFGGVFWDVQQVLLEDVERIEVVSGPGASLWGANAVNGIIHVVTKNARDTQGLYASFEQGSFMRNFGAARFGGKAGDKVYYRVYGQRLVQKGTRRPNGTSAHDDWHLSQGGFRVDYFPSAADHFTLQSDVYRGGEGIPTSARVNGQNLLARWTRTFSDTSALKVQAYWDRASRQLPLARFADRLVTTDLDLQHSFALGRHHVTWGGDVRHMRDRATNSPSLSFSPATKTMRLYSGFVQDEITLVPERWRLTLGSKLERNDFSGVEVQPSLRVSWLPAPRHLLWSAISRAVRSPSRFDADERTPAITTPGQVFDSEKVTAYELGYRLSATNRWQFSVATFFNDYDDLRSINVNPLPPPALIFANDQKAQSLGAEVSSTWQPNAWWRLRGGYTFLDKKISARNPAVIPGSDRFEANDPQQQFLLHSTMDLSAQFRFDAVMRFVTFLPSTVLPTPRVPSYASADVRITWSYRHLELSVAGTNLLDPQHPEFGSLEIPRGWYAKATWRY